MKKLFLSISFILVFLSSYAQSTGKKVNKTINHTKKIFKQVEYGIKTGVNLTNIRGLSNAFRTSFNLGFYGVYNVDPNMAIQSELLFSSQGFKNKSKKETVSNAYLNIPITFQYRLLDALTFEIGPQLGFSIIKDNYHRSIISTISANTFDVGLVVGTKCGIGKYLKIPGLNLTTRYVMGLMDVYKIDKNHSNKNSVFQTGLSYAF